MARRLFETVAPWFADAFAEHAGDLEVSWELSLTTLPDPSRNHQFVSALTLYTEIPATQPGLFLANTVMMSPGFDQNKVAETVHQLVLNVREQLASNHTGPGDPDLTDLGNGQR